MKDITLAEILAAASALAFLLTVSYGFGFSMVLGFSVFKYFTVNDFFRQAVLWLATSALPFGLGLFMSRLQTDPSSAGPHAKHLKGFSIVIIMPVLLLGVSFFKPVPRQIIFLAAATLAAAIWALLASIYLSKPLIKERWPNISKDLLFLAPIGLIVAFCIGATNAEDDYRYLPSSVSTRVFLKDQPRLLTGTILLSLDQFLLLRDDDNQQVKVIPQSEIKMIIHDN